MPRISENQVNRGFLEDIIKNRSDVNKYSEEVSTGLKVQTPGDSKQAGTIAKFQDSLVKIDGYLNRVNFAEGFLTSQEDALGQAMDLLIRAKEIAAQGANETNSPTERASLAEEVFEVRDHLVSLANTTYLGRYIFSGLADDAPAYSRSTDYIDPPTVPPASTPLAAYHYAYNNNDGSDLEREVQITDSLRVPVNTPGNTIFGNAIQGMEELGRALAGYNTNFADPTNVAAGENDAMTFPTDYDQQTLDIKAAMDLIDVGRESDIMPERANIAGRTRRLETARGLLDLSKVSAQDVLSRLQDADITESAGMLAEAQTALQASYQVTNQILNLSILDFI